MSTWYDPNSDIKLQGALKRLKKYNLLGEGQCCMMRTNRRDFLKE